MTPGNNGASTPEDDDPFGYLYADGQAAGAQPPSGGGGYGYPGSVNRSRPVGERQYGQPAAPTAPTAQYGQVPPQQGTYGQPNANYSAPEAFPGGAPTTYEPLPDYAGSGGGGGRGRGPNTKGLLIGAVAVVAAVVIGIGIAMLGGDSDDDKGGDATGSTPPPGQSVEPSAEPTKESEAPADLPTIDAKALKLGSGVTTASDVDGASSAGGIYVTGLNTVGSEVTWSVSGIPEGGVYTLFAVYSAAGDDQEMTLTVNGKPFGNKLNLGNFAKAGAGEFEKGWTQTYAWPTLNKGTNTISLSCQTGDKCDVLLDQLSLKAGQVKR
ncbi:carbohydrate-binding protein [Streptomyces sp. NBC_00878]|uniref:carbohydrate-binding protein n=1 Tax=Streptomyces sp. NBC_00878 TaxID=2975854 RepID=UPI002254FE5F|nr:carbohydrate-binding protein [Streptomyces sp. NBC_00878]MCX4906619.1 carbohydrate-binding protein [Streptomyces sp. NBC_00878]